MRRVRVSEDDVEQLAMLHFAQLGYEQAHGPDIAPDEPASERASYGDVILRGRLEAALHRLNPDVPPAAVEATLRKILVSEAPTLVQNNRAFHKMLRDGVEVEVAGKKGQTLTPRLRLLDQFAHARDALHDHRGQLVALAFARRHQFVERAGGQSRDLRLQLIESQRVVRQHARPAQQLRHGKRRGARTAFQHGRLQSLQLRQKFRVQRQFPCDTVIARERQPAFDLATRDARTDRFTQHRLGKAQIVCDAEGNVKVARIDAAQLDVEGQPPEIPGLGGEAGHAEYAHEIDLSSPAAALQSLGKA